MKPRPRILVVLTYYSPHWTGLTEYARRLAEAFVRHGYPTSVLTCRHEANLPAKESINGVTVHRMPVVFRLSRTLISLQLLMEMPRMVRASDRVVVYLPFAEVAVIAFWCTVFRKPLFLVHNGDLKLPNTTINKWIEWIYIVFTNVAAATSRRIFVQTADYVQSSRLLTRWKHRISIVPPLFTQYRKPRQIPSSRLGKIPPNAIAIGFGGRFVEEKGFDILLRSIPAVVRRYPRVIFLFAGETDIPYESFFAQNAELYRQVKPYIRMLGKLTQKEMQRFFAECTLFVLPSRSDCYPSILVEALLAGIPVVVTDIPGARMPVKQTGMGIVVPPENPQALAKGILAALRRRPALHKRWSSVQSFYDYEKTFTRYETIIAEGN